MAPHRLHRRALMVRRIDALYASSYFGIADLVLVPALTSCMDRLPSEDLDRALAAAQWIQAEHRRQPDLLVAQTGYMQGAAGIGMLLLHWHAVEHGLSPQIVLPDDPFGRADLHDTAQGGTRRAR